MVAERAACTAALELEFRQIMLDTVQLEKMSESKNATHVNVNAANAEDTVASVKYTATVHNTFREGMVMGKDRPYTAAELAQIQAEQNDPAFLQWLADMDREIEVFLTQDVPGMSADPYTHEGLNHLEDTALKDFWNEPIAPGWPDRKARYARFIGDMLVKKFEGTWKYIDMNDEKGLRPVVNLPFHAAYYDPANRFRMMLAHRTGGRLSRMVALIEKDYASWVEHGRMPLEQWSKDAHRYRK